MTLVQNFNTISRKTTINVSEASASSQPHPPKKIQENVTNPNDDDSKEQNILNNDSKFYEIEYIHYNIV